MIAKTLVFVCAAFGLVAGSCFEVAQQQCSQSCPQVITLPALPECPPPSLPECFSSCSSDNTVSEVLPTTSVQSVSCCLQPGNGPEGDSYPTIQAPAVTLPSVEGPTITLCSPPIPAPRVIAQRCICTKTIVKPQIIQRTVTIPRLQRYIKRTVTPVVENVSYKSTPISQESGSSSVYVPSSGSSSCGQSQVVISGSSCPRAC